MATKDPDIGYHGYRYLVDAYFPREFAVRFENDRPKKPITVFEKGGPGKFRPSEVVFALDDEVEITTGPAGSQASTVLFMITTDANGEPRNIKTCGCEYDVKFSVTGSTLTVSYELTSASMRALESSLGTSSRAPRRFENKVPVNSEEVWRHGSSVVVSPALLRRLPFPPNHEGSAMTARTAVAAASAEKFPSVPQAAEAPATTAYAKVDDQTLSETKKLGNGEKLKILFDFEARRVTEVFETSSKLAMTGHTFEEHDQEALQKAHDRLVGLSGKPKPLDGKKFPSLKVDPK